MHGMEDMLYMPFFVTLESYSAIYCKEDEVFISCIGLVMVRVR